MNDIDNVCHCQIIYFALLLLHKVDCLFHVACRRCRFIPVLTLISRVMNELLAVQSEGTRRMDVGTVDDCLLRLKV